MCASEERGVRDVRDSVVVCENGEVKRVECVCMSGVVNSRNSRVC